MCMYAYMCMHVGLVIFAHLYFPLSVRCNEGYSQCLLHTSLNYNWYTKCSSSVLKKLNFLCITCSSQTHTYTNMPIRARTHTHTQCIHTHAHTCSHTHTHMLTHVTHKYAHMHTHTHTHTKDMCILTHTHTFSHIHKYTQTHKIGHVLSHLEV